MVDAVGGAALAALAGLPPSGAWPFIAASALVQHCSPALSAPLLLATASAPEPTEHRPSPEPPTRNKISV
jgi:hypothetical protein